MTKTKKKTKSPIRDYIREALRDEVQSIIEDLKTGNVSCEIDREMVDLIEPGFLYMQRGKLKFQHMIDSTFGKSRPFLDAVREYVEFRGAGAPDEESKKEATEMQMEFQRAIEMIGKWRDQ